MADNKKKSWIKVGKFEHCAPAQKFYFKGQTFDGKDLNEVNLAQLLKLGYAMVREGKPGKTEAPVTPANPVLEPGDETNTGGTDSQEKTPVPKKRTK